MWDSFKLPNMDVISLQKNREERGEREEGQETKYLKK